MQCKKPQAAQCEVHSISRRSYSGYHGEGSGDVPTQHVPAEPTQPTTPIQFRFYYGNTSRKNTVGFAGLTVNVIELVVVDPLTGYQVPVNPTARLLVWVCNVLPVWSAGHDRVN